MTGLTVTYPEILGKQLELLTELMPGLSRVAVIRDPDAISPQVHLTQRSVIQTAARSRRVSIDFIEVRSPSDLDAAFRQAAQDRRQRVGRSSPFTGLLPHRPYAGRLKAEQSDQVVLCSIDQPIHGPSPVAGGGQATACDEDARPATEPGVRQTTAYGVA